MWMHCTSSFYVSGLLTDNKEKKSKTLSACNETVTLFATKQMLGQKFDNTLNYLASLKARMYPRFIHLVQKRMIQ